MPRFSATCFRALAVVFAAALFFAVAVPHVHADASHSHQAQTCRACKLQDGFSATPAAEPTAALPAIRTSAASIAPSDAPCVILFALQRSPRAPPAIS